MWRVLLVYQKDKQESHRRYSPPLPHETAIDLAYNVADNWEVEGLQVVELDDPNDTAILAGVNPETGEQERRLYVWDDPTISAKLPLVKAGEYAGDVGLR